MFATLITIKSLLKTFADGAMSFSFGILNSNSAVVEKVATVTGVDSTILSQYFESLKAMIIENFGESGLYAAYIATAAIVIYVLSKLFKISFAILKFVVVPSVALAFAATFFLPYNFGYCLPVTVSLFSVMLLFRG